MKPYQKKYKRKEGKKHTRWTEADLTALRTMHQQGMPHFEIGKLLDRSTGAITAQIFLMKKRDAAEGYVHVAGGVTELSTSNTAPEPVSVSVSTSAPEPAKADPYVLTDAMLEDFNLFSPVTKDAWEEANPSLWQRIKRWFKK